MLTKKNKKRPLQIHIDGAKRAGKTTLGKGLRIELTKRGMRAVLIDMDEVRTKIFGKKTGLPDSKESLHYRDIVARIICALIVPLILSAGGVPIVVMDHRRKQMFLDILKVSNELETSLKFIVLQSPSLEEVTRRAHRKKEDDFSDMTDFSEPKILRSFLKSVARVQHTYRDTAHHKLLQISQSTPEDMVARALQFILN